MSADSVLATWQARKTAKGADHWRQTKIDPAILQELRGCNRLCILAEYGLDTNGHNSWQSSQPAKLCVLNWHSSRAILKA